MLLLQVNIPQAPVGREVHFVTLDCAFIASLGLLEVFIAHVLMTTQCVGICTALVKLNGTVEELDRYLVLFLQRERIAYCHPRTGREGVQLDCHIGSLAEYDLLLELPQAG